VIPNDGNRTTSIMVGSLVLLAWAGCAAPPRAVRDPTPPDLKAQARECLKAAVRYPHNPVVRVEAVEALQVGGSPDDLPWIRTALLDEHPAVRFAGCMAVGMRRDSQAETLVGERLNDADANVRVAALFAMHRLGRREQTAMLTTYLLDHEAPTVRRNAALALGLLETPSAVRVLARAMKDSDGGVRHHALEAMARLGNQDARQELTFMTSCGVGSDEVFAIHALAQTGDSTYADTFRYKLQTADHLETRLAAARGLGMLGSGEGLSAAMDALRVDQPTIDDPKDPVVEQILRRKQLAAAALGAIGRAEALPLLADRLAETSDPRLQVSAAQAILRILGSRDEESPPFAAARAGSER